MSLIVEDGSGVEGANSYNTIEEIRAYASARGIELPPDDPDVSVLGIQATDYLESKRDKYKGKRTTPTQELQWPRTGVVIDDTEVAEDEIPSLLKKAHAQASCEAYETDLIPNQTQRAKREKVDVIEVEYEEGTAHPGWFPKVESLLAPLLKSVSKFPMRTVRR